MTAEQEASGHSTADSALLVRGATGDVSVTPATAGWRYVSFSTVRLANAGDRQSLATKDQEACLVILAGRVEVRSGETTWADVGERSSPFAGPPHAFYAPPRTDLELRAVDAPVEIAVGTAPAERGARLRHIRPADTRREVRGSGVTERTIHHILMEDAPAERLLVTEVVTPAGHWSSYPPHKHDVDDPPRETQLEETYYHRLRDSRGFALQRVYAKDGSLDESVAVRDGDLVLVPSGYHTVSAAPGYELYYLNVMAGPVRKWCVTFDTDHEWVRR